MTGGTDHDFPAPAGFVGWTDEDDREFAPRLLAQERAADRVRWHGRGAWHPVMTYSAIMIASGWLAGAWYAWQINDDGAQLVVCLIGCLSTIFPGVPWQELVAMAKSPKSPTDPNRVNP